MILRGRVARGGHLQSPALPNRPRQPRGRVSKDCFLLYFTAAESQQRETVSKRRQKRKESPEGRFRSVAKLRLKLLSLATLFSASVLLHLINLLCRIRSPVITVCKKAHVLAPDKNGPPHQASLLYSPRHCLSDRCSWENRCPAIDGQCWPSTLLLFLLLSFVPSNPTNLFITASQPKSESANRSSTHKRK